MEKNRSRLSERILQLTLEVVYLLTGENYIAFKISKGMAPPSVMNAQSRVTQHPSISLIPENKKKKKVREVTNKIIELLTGEEEREYLEGHRDLYKETMMEDKPPLTLSDLSRKNSFSNKCLQPPHSTQDKHTTPQVDGPIVLKVKVKNEEDIYVGGDERGTEGESSQESSTDEHNKVNYPEKHPVIPPVIKKEKNPMKTDGSVVAPSITDLFDGSKVIPGIPNSFGSSDVMPSIPHVFSGSDLMPSIPNVFDVSKVMPSIPNIFGGLDVMPSIPNIQLECYSDDLLSDPSTHNGPFPNRPHPIKRRRSHKLNETFMCSLCGKCFNKRTKFIEHFRTHSGEKPYSCPICEKRFARKHSLIEHQKSHTGENQFSCTECGKQFARKQSLIEHQRAHTGDKLFPCPECGKVFTRRPNLIKHQRTHPRENSYACAECGQCFSDKSCFISHQKFHAGDNPYPCPDCGKCFKREKEMRAHLKSHKGDWPYSCGECGKKFRDKAYFVAHLTLHSGDKPHGCEECGKSFAFKSSFQRHQRMHARKNQWKEPIDYDNDMAPDIEDEPVPSSEFENPFH